MNVFVLYSVQYCAALPVPRWPALPRWQWHCLVQVTLEFGESSQTTQSAQTVRVSEVENYGAFSLMMGNLNGKTLKLKLNPPHKGLEIDV